MARKFVWTKEADAELVRLRTAGLSWREIADTMVVAQSVAAKRGSQLGLAWQGASKPFSDEEVKSIIALHKKGLSTSEISKAINRRRNSIQRKLKALGLRSVVKPRANISDDDIERAWDMSAAGMAWVEIAKRLGVKCTPLREACVNASAAEASSVPPAVVTLENAHIEYLEACADELGALTNNAMRREYTARCELAFDPDPPRSLASRFVPSYAVTNSMVGTQFWDVLP